MRIAGKAAAVAVALGVVSSVGQAETISYCVTCSEPAQTYICHVDTPDGNPGDRALQLYCMVNTAKDGGHRTCGASRETAGQCRGKVMSYTYNGPAGLPGVNTVIRHYRDKPPAPELPVAGEPEKPPTLFGLTSKAVKASGRGVKKTGKAVGDAARGAKRRVGNAGSAIGNAARSAFDCVKKLFRGCGKDESDDAAEATAEATPEPLSLAPENPKAAQ